MGAKEARPDAPAVPAAMLRKVEKICASLPETTCEVHPQVIQCNIRRRTFAHLLAPPDGDGRPIPMVIV